MSEKESRSGIYNIHLLLAMIMAGVIGAAAGFSLAVRLIRDGSAARPKPPHMVEVISVTPEGATIRDPNHDLEWAPAAEFDARCIVSNLVQRQYPDGKGGWAPIKTK